MKIKAINNSQNQMTQYDTGAFAGIYLRTYPESDILLRPIERSLAPGGLFLKIPISFEAKIRSGKDRAIKNEITILNSHSIIDTDYRYENSTRLMNLTSENFVIRDKDRICQIVIAKN